MVHLHPLQPTFETESERMVWDRLREQLGPDDVLLSGVRLTTRDKDYEADFVVVMPGFGILVLEVKGGSVWHDDDGWWIKRRGRPAAIRPVDQARQAKYALREYVELDPRWGSVGRLAFAHGVVTPMSSFEEGFDLPDLPRWALHDREDMATLVTRCRRNAFELQQGQRPPDADEARIVLEVLAGRRTTLHDVNADASERAERAERLTREQATILGVTRLLNRVEVRGGAGCGKTVLALEQARQLSAGRQGRSPQRVALLCYSIGLAEYLKRECATWRRREQPAFVGTFHEFGRQWGAPDGDRTDSEFWESELPELMAGLAGGLADGQRYDAVVVDEAQDFADAWWTPVLRSLRDEAESGVFVYSDENQRIFARYGRPPVALVPLVLDHNLRNTRQIHDCFGPLAPSRMYAVGGDGPEVRFVPSAADDAESAADDVVDQLLEEGWDPGRIALLTTGRRHPVQVERTDHHGQDGYWQSFWDAEEVFYGHVLGCKGLERTAVILCVNEDEPKARAAERLYVGMSRATDLLVVVGDPDVVRTMGGPQVAARLGV